MFSYRVYTTRLNPERAPPQVFNTTSSTSTHAPGL